MNNRHINEFYGEFSDPDRQNWIMWLRYYVETEAFDRTLPGGWFQGDWIPRHDFMGQSRAFAASWMKRLREHDDGRRALADSHTREAVARMGYDAQVRELAALTRPARTP